MAPFDLQLPTHLSVLSSPRIEQKRHGLLRRSFFKKRDEKNMFNEALSCNGFYEVHFTGESALRIEQK